MNATAIHGQPTPACSRHILTSLALFAFLAAPALLPAQTGSGDTSFFTTNANAVVYSAAVQADGKILIGGDFTTVGASNRTRIARLNSDGSVEGTNTFNVGTGASGTVACLAVQADGKIILGGSFSTVAGVARNRIARLNTNGTLDATFNPDAANSVNSIVVQPDGKILIGGSFVTVGGATRNRIARLNADGTLDATFNPNANSDIYGLALQGDGKILLGGNFTTIGASARTNLARLNTDGSVDASFNTNLNGTAYSVAVQADGKILVGGAFTAVGATARNRFARLNADASLDTGFNPNVGGNVLSMAVQADGKILFGGVFTTVGVSNRNRIARLNGDGSLDTNFNPNASSTVQGMAVQADGLILLGGNFTSVGGGNRTNVARLQNDAASQSLTAPTANRIEWLRGGSSPEAQGVSFDFSTDGGTNWIALGVGVRISGGWEITGLSLPPSGLARARARTSGGVYSGSSGMMETTAAFSGFTALAPLVTTGSATNVRDYTASLTASINPAGLATTAQFEYGATTNYGSVASIILSPTNGATTQTVSTAIAGLTPASTYHYRATASNSAGTTLGDDLTFTTVLLPDIAVEQPAGTNLTDGVGSISFGASLVGTTNPPTTFVIRNVGLTNLTGLVITRDGVHSNDFTLNTNGLSTTLEPGSNTTFTVTFAPGTTGLRTGAVHIASNDADETPFDISLLGRGYRPGDVETNLTGGANAFAYSTAVQADGKILLGGSFTTLAGTARNRIARLNADGTLDTGFNPNADNTVYCLAVQADGKILVGGFFTTIVGTTRNRIARLNADGTLDASFNPNASTTVYSLAVQADGKILVGGDFVTVGGVTRNRIARLNTDGSPDTNFNPNASSTVYSLAVQEDGKIVLGGSFTTIGVTARSRIARLNADGSLDAGFSTNMNSTVYSVAMQADGKILAGGAFTTVGVVTRNHLARLNADGSLDTGFNPNVTNGDVYGMAVQADGKIHLGGNFTTIGGTTRNRSARLLGDGSLDTNFNPNADSTVQGTAVQADGKVVVIGGFTLVGGLARTNVARLLNDAATQNLTVPTTGRVEWLRGGASPEAQGVSFDFSTDGGTNWIALGAGTRISGGWEITGLSLPPSGLVRARARVNGGGYNGSSGLVETSVPFSGFVASAPLVTTGNATNFSDTTMTLTASINPSGLPTTARFEYGLTTSYGLTTNIVLSPTNGATVQSLSAALAGLTPGTLYHYRAVATNSAGETAGADLTFTTLLLPDIAVEQPSGTNLADGATNNFGTNLMVVAGTPRTFIIRNLGLADLTNIVVTKDGAHAADFAVDTNGMSGVLAPGASTSFTVTFTPGTNAARTAAIHIANNDPDENPFDINLTGTGYRAGDVDLAFNPNASSWVYATALQPDGKIILGGAFATIGGLTRTRMARLNSDGTLEATNTFNPVTAAAGSDVNCTAVQADGKILIGGGFIAVGGVTRNRIARLNANGTLDTGFNPNCNNSVYGLVIQPDGKTLFGGNFTTVGGVTRRYLARLNADGTLDVGFNPSVSNYVNAVTLQPDGKIIIGGFFDGVGGQWRTNLARLNADGTVDTGFNPGANSSVYALVVQPDGKILLGGNFTTVAGVTRNRSARLNADGTLDAGFNPNANSDVYTTVLQADGKILIGGSISSVGGQSWGRLVRLNTNGTVDTTFNTNASSTVYGTQLQPDGMVLIAGSFSIVSGQTRNNFARLQNDPATQSLTVPAFSRIEWLRGGASPEAESVTFDLSTDGGANWVALGAGTRISGGWELNGLTLPASGQVRGRARMSGGYYNGSSSLIETVTPFSGFASSAPLVTTTAATNIIDVSATLTAIVNPAGSATTARFEYGPTTGYGLSTNITLSPANGATTQNVSTVISGLTPGTLYHFRAVATNSAGETAGGDLTFTTLLLPEIAVAQPVGTNLTDGVSTNNFGTNLMALAGVPRIFVISNLGLADLVISAITKDGTHSNDFAVDTNGMSMVIAPGASTTFTVTFTPGTNTVRTAALHLANNDLDEGSFDIPLTGTGYKAGDLDPFFNPNASDTVFSTAVQIDGKIVVRGSFTQMGGTARTNLARLNADGTLDSSYNPAPNSSVDAITLESSRKLLVGGFFTNLSGQARTRLARLNTDGSADLAVNSGANSSIYSIVPQPDGKLILCGNFTNVAGVARNRIARLNSDGTLDAGFNPNADSSVTGALLQPDGRIIVWGNFDNMGGAARHRIARLNTNGTLESVFNPNPDISVSCATLQADGKILVGGTFTAIAGTARNRLARLNDDGTLDTGFNPNANEYVNSILVQTDGKILVGGLFTSVGGAARNYIARLNTNGVADSVFNPGTGSSTVGLGQQPDGKILVMGSFTLVAGQARNRIARLLNENVTETLTVASADRVEWLRGGAAPEAMWVGFELSMDGGTSWLPLGQGTRIGGGWELTGLSLPVSGHVRAQARVSGGAGNSAFSVVEAVTAFAGLPAPEIAVAQPAGTTVADGGSRAFGSVLLGTNASLTFTITNSGTANLNSLVITKDGANSADFVIDTNGTGMVLAPGASTTFTVTFVPGALGAKAAALHIASSDADENPYDISLSGTGVAPEIVVEQPAGTSLIDGTASIGFGTTGIGTNAVKTFTITNTGTSDLLGIAVTTDGANSGDFAVDTNGMSTTLAPGAGTAFTVTFTPALAGEHSAALHIASSDADENSFDISLTGTGANQTPVVANSIPDQNATATVPFSYSFPANTFSDPDTAQTLTLTATRTSGAALPTWLTFTAATRTFSGTPSPNDVGTLNVRVTATDNGAPPLAVNEDFDIVVAPIAPVVATLAATSVGAYGATLQANVNPNGLTTTAQFEYGTTTGYGTAVTITLTPANGTNTQSVSSTIPGLLPNTTYHFRATATNAAGGNAGGDLAFTTTPPPPGIADTNFNPSSILGVLDLAMQPDGKILVGGDYMIIGPRAYLPRLNPDGSVDLGFDPFNFSRVFTVVVQPDGKVIVGGMQANADTGINLVRMNADGTIDDSFDRFAVNNVVQSLALQPDGKVILAGAFTTVLGQPRNRIARLNADGTLDPGFNPNANSTVMTVTLQTDGKIFMGGFFTQVAGVGRDYSARLNADGTLDASYTPHPTDWVFGSTLQADGKILMSGSFGQVDGLARPYFARLNTNGTLDTTFNAGVNSSVDTVALQTDGKMLVGGGFTTIGGQSRSRIARLNADGSADAAFDPGANSVVYALALQSDGKMIVGGQFTNISGQAHTRLARLSNDPATQNLAATSASRIEWLRGGTSPETHWVTFEMSVDGGTSWLPLGSGTRISGGWEKTGLVLPPSGQIRARAQVHGGSDNASSGLIETVAAFSGFPPTAPFASTLAASALTETGATLHAHINPAGAATVAQFDYGTSTNYGSTAAIALSPADGEAGQAVNTVVSGLLPGTAYHFRAAATNGLGGAAGGDFTFTTPAHPEIAVEQPAGTTLTDGATVAFGTNIVGTPLTKTFTITNLGTTNLAGLSISKDGASAAEFIVGALTNLIPPGGSATFDVTFNPTPGGTKTAAIHITSNDSDESPFDINLSGFALAPEIVVESPPGTGLTSRLVACCDTVAFDWVGLGVTNSKTVLIRNIGTADLNLSGLALIGANVDQFTLGPLNATNVPPGSNATFVMYFHPTSGGPKDASFQIFNNDSNENPFQIEIFGAGLVPDITVEQPLGVGLTNGAGTVDFGSTSVGTPVVKTFSIGNSGPYNYNLTGLVVTKDGTNAADFVVGSLSSTSVSLGAYASFTVTFTPSTAGTKTAAIHIASNDPDENPFDIALTGIANGPEIVVEQPSGTDRPDGDTNSFGSVNVGGNADLTFTITNTGSASLTGLGITFDGPDAAQFTTTSSPTAPVSAGGSTTFTVRFAPTTVGAKSAALHIASNDGDENPFDIHLTGTGTAPEIAVEQPPGADRPDGDTNSFGSVNVGGNADLTFTITNTGSADLTGLGITFDGPDAAAFTVTASPTAPVSAGGSTTFTVRFAPGSVGAKTAALHIANNDSDENSFDIILTGTGAAPEIAVEQPPGTDRPDGDTNNFGSVNVGGNADLTFTITNTGSASLTGLGITFDGPDAAQFTVTASPTAPVSAGGSTTFTVRFAPTTVGAKSAALHIANNDSDENPFDITLTGTGTAPEIAVEQPPGTDRPDGDTNSFGSVNVGGNADLTFTITNTGSASLTGLGITFSGASAAEFSVTTNPVAPVTGPGGSTTFTLRFAPTTVGAKSAALHIASNDGDENPFDIILTGTGTAPEIAVEQPPGTDRPDGDTNSFGSVRVGGDTNLTFTITNTGSADLTGLAITFDGPDAAEFTITTSPTAPVIAGGSTTFTVRFTPASGGAKTAALHIASNDSDENPFDITLTGTAIANSPPTLTRANATVVVPVNTSATNTGTFGDANGDSLVLAASIGVITPGAGTWSWTHTPGAVGSQTVVITADDGQPGGTNLVTFTLTATEVTPPTAAFEPVLPDPRTNAVGTVTLNFSEDVSGVDTNDFVLTLNGSPVSLAGLVVTQINAATYSLDLTVFTATSGGYVLTLVAAGSGIVDAFGNALAADATNAFGVAASSTTVSNGNLAINNVQGGTMALTIGTVSVGGTNYIELHDANNPIIAGAGATQVDANTIRVPAASVTNQLQITGGTGDDHFVLDATAGCPLPPGGVNIDGGGQTLNGADTLQVIGTFSSVTYDANNIGAGNLSDDCNTVNFAGLEPVDYTSASISNLTINVNSANLFPGSVTTTLSAMPGAGHAAHTRVDFTGGLELMDFGTLVGTLTITGNSAQTDTILVQGVGTNFAGNLVLVAQAADLIVFTNGPLVLGAGKNFSVTAGSVTLGAVSVVAGGTVSFHGGGIALHLGGVTTGPAANQHSRLSVAGAVVLSNSPALNLTGSYVPQSGDAFTLVDNDGNDAITGTFAGLPEGTTFSFNGVLLRISYVGGDGNDVVLVNTPPGVAANNATVTVPEGATATNSGTFNDAEGNATVTLSASIGTVTPSNGAGTWSWSFNTSDGPDQSQTITITANDGVNTAVTTTFTLTVSNVAPSALAQNVTTPEDTSTNLVLTATDPGADTITNWVITVNPLHGTLSGTGANRTYAPASNYHGADFFKFTATDSDGATSAEATVNLTIVPSNDAPVPGALANYTVNPGAVIAFNATATDADQSDVLSFALLNPPTHAGISSVGSFSWRPRVAQAGTTNTVTVVVTDNGVPNLSATNSFTVIVNPLAPVVLTPSGYVGGQFQFEVSGTTGPDYVISTSTNLVDWLDTSTNLAPAMPFQFTDPGAGTNGFKSYRVRLQP